MLHGKKIILGVCGSIAAYKAAFLLRLLKKEGAEVQVIMTDAARDFITPLTLATLSERPVLSKFVKDETGEWHNHVDLGLWADLMLIAPASANTMGALANGLCSNLLQAVYLSARCPVMIAPAMDLDMYQHPATLRNMDLLGQYGNQIIDAEHGELASGLVGKGRMAEPEHIVAHLKDFFGASATLKGTKVLITAGPTREQIDPVRYIGNHSSGKMGYALAENLAAKGAEVVLVSGPTQQKANHSNIRVVPVQSALEMYEASTKHYPDCQIAILAAAVADYTPREKHEQKIKKEGGATELTIALVQTHDIAAELGRRKQEGQINIGFALETNDEEANAQKKLQNKNFDLIVLNSLNDPGAGFGTDTNKVTLLDADGKRESFPLKSKQEVAEDIVQAILKINSHAAV